MRIAGYFGALLDSEIPGIPIRHFIIFSNQRGCLCNIVGICRPSSCGRFAPLPADCVKKQLVQTVSFQKMVELTQGCFVWHCFCHEVNACEFPHGIAVVDSILGSRIGQVEPNLKQIHPQHFFNAHGRTSTLSLGIVGLDDTNPLVSGNDFVHDFQKLFPLRFLLAEAVLDVCKCFLLHCLHHRCFDGVIIPYLEPLW